MNREEMRAHIDDKCDLARIAWEEAVQEAREREAEIARLNQEMEELDK
jgi:hypothetical protein